MIILNSITYTKTYMYIFVVLPLIYSKILPPTVKEKYRTWRLRDIVTTTKRKLEIRNSESVGVGVRSRFGENEMRK